MPSHMQRHRRPLLRVVHVGLALALVICTGMLGNLAGEHDAHLRGVSIDAFNETGSITVQDSGATGGSVSPRMWLSVEGTDIGCSVAELSSDMPDDFYLDHAYDGTFSRFGCPYLDRRSAAEGVHLLVYGHHMARSPVVFGSLAACYRQDEFDALGMATLTVLEDGRETAYEFQPLCAKKVPASYAAIQRFSFSSAETEHSWLTGIAEHATARSDGWREQVARTERVLTLVTCTEGNGQSSYRTIVLFTTEQSDCNSPME